MHVYIGSDHGGFKLKEVLKNWMESEGLEFTDLGCFSEESVDYPEIAHEVCEKVNSDPASRGVLVCGTGLGMSMVANKLKGVRAAMCTNEFMAQMAREHNNAQVICMGGRVSDEETSRKMLSMFLKTDFSGEDRHKRRISKIEG